MGETTSIFDRLFFGPNVGIRNQRNLARWRASPNSIAKECWIACLALLSCFALFGVIPVVFIQTPGVEPFFLPIGIFAGFMIFHRLKLRLVKKIIDRPAARE